MAVQPKSGVKISLRHAFCGSWKPGQTDCRLSAKVAALEFAQQQILSAQSCMDAAMPFRNTLRTDEGFIMKLLCYLI